MQDTGGDGGGGGGEGPGGAGGPGRLAQNAVSSVPVQPAFPKAVWFLMMHTSHAVHGNEVQFDRTLPQSAARAALQLGVAWLAAWFIGLLVPVPACAAACPKRAQATPPSNGRRTGGIWRAQRAARPTHRDAGRS
eukprot:SAG11_NODE_6294_length_1343_cov_1.311093_1_plen_135_part_00